MMPSARAGDKQRTATFTVPAANRPMTENERKATKRSYKQLREQMRRSQVGVLLEPGIGNFADVDLRVVRGELERRWRGAGMTALPGGLQRKSASMRERWINPAAKLAPFGALFCG